MQILCGYSNRGVNLVTGCKHPVGGDYDNQSSSKGVVNQGAKQPIIMAYRTEQLAIPKQMNKLRNEMLITAKERSIASKSQLKGHAHHYFVSPYRNPQQSDNCPAMECEREMDTITRLSHPDGIMTLHAASPLDAAYSKTGSETSRSLPTEPKPLPARDKLPAIVNFRKQPSRSQRDTNRWLGPPNSIPPNKRSEHVAAYKTRDIPHHVTHPVIQHVSTPLLESESEAEIDGHVQYGTDNEQTPILYHNFRRSARYHGERYDDDDDSSASLYPSDVSDSADTYSIASDKQFTHLRFIDKPFAKHLSSPATSLQLKSLASHTHRSSTRFDDSSEQYSAHAALLLPYGDSTAEDMSTMSVHSHDTRARKKVVHFDPQVRDVSRENRSAPLVASKSSSYYGGSPREPVNYKLDITPASDAVDQLPAVVEKYMIKSLPVLPSINHSNKSAMNINANVIYIKGGTGGKAPSNSVQSATVTASKPILIARHNVIDTSPRGLHTHGQTVSHQHGGVLYARQNANPHGHAQTYVQSVQSVPTRVHAASHKTHAVKAVPQLSRVAEESSNPSLSPSPQHKHAAQEANRQKQAKVQTPATPHRHAMPASTATHHTNASQASQQTSHALSQQNTQQQAALAHAANPKQSPSKKTASKKVKTDTSKKSTSTKRSKGRKGRSSDSSSRNSPTTLRNSPSESPVNDVIDEAELREQRQREYAAAMLAVQQRMREFDLRYGKKSELPKEEDMDRSPFGKVIPPKTKPKLNKMK